MSLNGPPGMSRVQKTAHTDVLFDPCRCMGVASSRLTFSDPTRIPAEPFSYIQYMYVHPSISPTCTTFSHQYILYVLYYIVRTITLASAHTWGIGTTKKRRPSHKQFQSPIVAHGTSNTSNPHPLLGAAMYLPMMQEYPSIPAIYC